MKTVRVTATVIRDNDRIELANKRSMKLLSS